MIFQSSLSSNTSLPAWGVWIEISGGGAVNRIIEGRSPHGECGLKCLVLFELASITPSLPAWGVWIEIEKQVDAVIEVDVAPRMGSVD